jgi:hypothetical protein
MIQPMRFFLWLVVAEWALGCPSPPGIPAAQTKASQAGADEGVAEHTEGSTEGNTSGGKSMPVTLQTDLAIRDKQDLAFTFTTPMAMAPQHRAMSESVMKTSRFARG